MRLAMASPAETGAVVFPDSRESDDAYQRRLALSLIDAVGFEGAIRYCRNNSWDGVLRAVRALSRAGTA